MIGERDAVRSLRTRVGVVAGDEGAEAAPAIVLVPSLGTTQQTYDGLATRLVLLGYRVIRPDIRGHGLSKGSAQINTIDNLAGDLCELLDLADIARANVLGCSVGAMAAIRFTARFPDRCRRLILTGADSSFQPAELWEGRIRLVEEHGMAGLADGAVERWVTESTMRDRAEAVTRLRTDMLGLDPAVFVRYAKMMTTADVTDDLSTLHAPTLVVVGEHDQSSPVSAAERLGAATGGQDPVVVPGARHLLHLDQLDRLVEEVSAFACGRPSAARPVAMHL